MKRARYSVLKYLLVILFLATISVKGSCQTPIPEVLNTGTLKEQMDYIEERTRIYENYRAIREDMFQLIKGNSIDSLIAEKNTVNQLTVNRLQNKETVDSLSAVLGATQVRLKEATDSKNSISVLGMEFSKTLYNLFTWIIIAGLLFILGVGFLAFRRNMVMMIHAKKDLEELRNEFETYRQTAREAREKMSMDHFNEIRRIKGG